MVLPGMNIPNAIKVIKDASGTVRTYSFPGTTYAINSVVDTNGSAGGEIVVLIPNSLKVIRDATGTVVSYSFTGTTYGVNTVVDTNNVSGNDIVATTPSNIRIIHDKNQTTSTYAANGTYAIVQVKNYDSIADKEVCYNTNGSPNYWLITDRTSSQASRANCN